MNRPLVIVALAYASGTFLAARGASGGVHGALLALALGAGAAALVRRRDLRRVAGIAFVFAALGALMGEARHTGPPGDPLGRHAAAHPYSQATLEGRVRAADLADLEEAYQSFVLDVSRAQLSGAWRELPGRALVRWTYVDTPVAVGERVRISGRLEAALGRVNPGITGTEDILRRRGAHSLLRANRPRAIDRLAPAGRWDVFARAHEIRVAQAERIQRAVPEPAQPFVRAVFLGSRSEVEPELYEDFIASGTAHIFAVSGIHMGIVYVTANALLRLLIPARMRRRRAAAVMTIVFLFALMTGARASAMRAAGMVLMYVAAEFFNRDSDPPTALGMAALVFLLVDPGFIVDAGALLSFLSVASILIFGDLFETRLQRLPYFARGALSTTLAAQILPLPVATHAFHVLPMIAPVANLAAVPLLSMVLWLCFFGAIADWFSQSAGILFGHAVAPLVYLLNGWAHVTGDFPFGHVRLTSPAALASLSYFAAAYCLYQAVARQEMRRRWLSAMTICLALMVAFWLPWEQDAKIVFLDVGHGDATFIRTPAGATMLIDGGNETEYAQMGSRVVAPFLWSEGVTRLDYAVATHPDRDHMGGLFYVLEHFDVGAVLLGPRASGVPLEEEFLALCARRGAPVRRMARGEVVPLAGAAVEALHPPANAPAWGENNDSLVLRVGWEGVRVLLPGDIEADAERVLARQDCAADILRAPHHGSSTSSTDALLEAVNPKTVVVSTGLQGGRLVASDTVAARYSDYGIDVWRTDRLGAITLRLEAGSYLLEAARFRLGYPTVMDEAETRIP